MTNTEEPQPSNRIADYPEFSIQIAGAIFDLRWYRHHWALPGSAHKRMLSDMLSAMREGSIYDPGEEWDDYMPDTALFIITLYRDRKRLSIVM